MLFRFSGRYGDGGRRFGMLVRALAAAFSRLCVFVTFLFTCGLGILDWVGVHVQLTSVPDWLGVHASVADGIGLCLGGCMPALQG